MGGRRRPVNFGDPMYVATSVGRAWEHVRPREVSRSLVAFEEGLSLSVRACAAKYQGYVPGISEIREY
jgi:hypothetical protein